jgi:hypothetical protein
MKAMRNCLAWLYPSLGAGITATLKEIIVPFDIDLDDHAIKFTVPNWARKRKLLDLSQKNVSSLKRKRLTNTKS